MSTCQTTGQVMLRTTAHGRRWAYAGAVCTGCTSHRFVNTRQFGSKQCLGVDSWLRDDAHRFAMGDLVRGVAPPPWSQGEERAWSPYAGLMRWHHYAGLVFGCATFTWILSGCLSLEPFSWHPGTTPTAEQQAAVAGAPYRIRGIAVEELERVLTALSPSLRPVNWNLCSFGGRCMCGRKMA
ncbi:MAG: hypothetical protein Ct9H300mP25_13460 [Acidobacteriota bacterium]|nr:MAG: hypothetical protein Ct9H300mP25_13460 [Acidobacteriota bacterium]